MKRVDTKLGNEELIFNAVGAWKHNPKKQKPIRYIITDDGCHVVTSHYKDRDGYVTIKRRIDGIDRVLMLHRVSYENYYGEIPNGSVVMHSCDNPSCINPEHLSIGSTKDNQMDKVNKGRQARGKSNGKARLTEVDVLSIREDQRSIKEISQSYGVTIQHVHGIKRKKTWAHI